MKILLFLLSFPIICFSQDETLVGDGEISSGGFGGPSVKITKIYDDPAVLVGGRGGWIVNHHVVLGGGGYGLVNKIFVESEDGIKRRLSLGYGGFELGFVLKPHSLIHTVFTLLIGGGGVGFEENDKSNENHHSKEEHSGIFVLEPEIGAELNVSEYFRVAIGMGYRFVFGVDLANIQNKDLSFGNIVIAFKFGTF